jgi:glycosyltransferase involved in cell wall biosynthesis
VTRVLNRAASRKVDAELAAAARALAPPPLVVSVLPNRLDPALSGGHVARRLAASVGSGPLVLHCRGPRAAAVGLAVRAKIRGAKTIFDCRGARVEETRMTGEPERVVLQMERLERRASRESDAIVGVTRRMGEYLVERYGADPGKIVVVPAGCDETRFAFGSDLRARGRALLDAGDRPVFVFCGGWDPWQAVPLNAALLAALVRREPDALVVALSQDAARIDAALAAAGIPEGGRLVRKVPFDEVPAYLAAADGAVVLREADTVNRVASPVKFSEYKVSGLPVAVSEGLGDAADHVRATGTGVVYGGDPEEAAAKMVELVRGDRAEPERRARRAEEGARVFSTTANLALLEALYRRLLRAKA